jgi:glutathione synthase/RimK-type ligase-like ATP-grasp enzyme
MRISGPPQERRFAPPSAWADVSRLAGRRIELWVEARDGDAAVNSVMRALLDDLAAAGALVSVRVPEHEVVDAGQALTLRADLVLLKTATTLGLSLAVADEAAGCCFLNPAWATLRAHDKAGTAARLAAAGLPVPMSFLHAPAAADEVTMVRASRAAGAWVSKPARGVHGQGVAVHATLAAALEQIAAQDPGARAPYLVDDGTWLLQSRIGSRNEPDSKVYVAGEALFAGLKAFGPGSFARDDIEPCALSRAATEVVRAAGEALGLRCFGVDLRFERGSPVIVDANPFPGYRGFPAAVPALRSEVERALDRDGA